MKSIAGTAHYIAPEVMKMAYNEKCDIWSLGVIAYQLFSQGEYPFDDADENELQNKICKSKLYLPSEKTEKEKKALRQNAYRSNFSSHSSR